MSKKNSVATWLNLKYSSGASSKEMYDSTNRFLSKSKEQVMFEKGLTESEYEERLKFVKKANERAEKSLEKTYLKPVGKRRELPSGSGFSAVEKKLIPPVSKKNGKEIFINVDGQYVPLFDFKTNLKDCSPMVNVLRNVSFNDAHDAAYALAMAEELEKSGDSHAVDDFCFLLEMKGYEMAR